MNFSDEEIIVRNQLNLVGVDKKEKFLEVWHNAKSQMEDVSEFKKLNNFKNIFKLFFYLFLKILRNSKIIILL